MGRPPDAKTERSPATAIILRPAAPEDEDVLASIRSAAQGSFVDARRDPGDHGPARRELVQEPAPVPAEEQAQERSPFPHRLDIPHGEDYFCLVALDRTTVVGYVSAGGGRDSDRKSYAEIYEIAVEPSARRRGIGTQLIEEALRTLLEASYGGVTMWLLDGDRAAAALLSRAGFAPDGRRTTVDATGADACRYAFGP